MTTHAAMLQISSQDTSCPPDKILKERCCKKCFVCKKKRSAGFRLQCLHKESAVLRAMTNRNILTSWAVFKIRVSRMMRKAWESSNAFKHKQWMLACLEVKHDNGISTTTTTAAAATTTTTTTSSSSIGHHHATSTYIINANTNISLNVVVVVIIIITIIKLIVKIIIRSSSDHCQNISPNHHRSSLQPASQPAHHPATLHPSSNDCDHRCRHCQQQHHH